MSNATRAWLALMGLTLLSWLLHDFITAAAIVYALIVLTIVKVYVIEWSFMEVPRTQIANRRFFFLWPAVIGSLFAGANWLTTGAPGM